MQLVSIRAVLTAVWVLAVCIAGLVRNPSALSGWILFAGIAVLPPLVLMWRWQNPGETMSESIREALR